MLDKIMYHYSRFGLAGVVGAAWRKLTPPRPVMKIRRKGVRFPFHLRPWTSDISAFEQIFIDREYEFHATSSPSVILDAGANVGLASIYFANKFPEARIIAIEPESENFKLLQQNTSPYGNITPVQAALWHRDEVVDLCDPGESKWSYMTHPADGGVHEGQVFLHRVRGITVPTLLREHGLTHIDVFKIDIEGAELELFGDCSSWIQRVDAILIELHDRMKPGCSRSFDNATTGFAHRWTQGEKTCLSRGNCGPAHAG